MINHSRGLIENGDAWASQPLRDNGRVRLSLKNINAELAKRGHRAMLAKGDGYFYFWSGEAADWLDRTVRVPTLSSLSLEEWMKHFLELRKTNRAIQQQAPAKKKGKKRPAQK